jgi:hypothetical protein
MDIRIYNIDSKFRNTTSFPSSSDFVFNRVDQMIGTTNSIEPFNEKNVIEMKIISLELPDIIYNISSSYNNNKITKNGIDIIVPDGNYTKQQLVDYLNTNIGLTSVTYSSITGKVTIVNNNTPGILIAFPVSGSNYMSLGDILGFLSTTTIDGGVTSVGTSVMQELERYYFLKINEFGNIINKNRRYVSKITKCQCVNGETKLIGEMIKFDQPLDIPQLKISLEDEYGQLVSLGGNNFSFTLQVTVITNTILKNYSEIRFYKEDVMDRLLKSRMLSYYEKQSESTVNNTLTNTYNGDLVNLNNQQEYNTFGSRNNYAPSFSYFREQ